MSAWVVSTWDVSRSALLAALLWAALARGSVHGWPLAITQLLALFAVGAWVLAMTSQGVFEWRRTVLDTPLALFFLLVVTQIALGNSSLHAWALAPPTAPPEFTFDIPARFWLLGTVAPTRTAQALGFFATYVAVYVLVVNVIRERRHLHSFLRVLLSFGAALAFAALLDYIVGERWLLRWSERQEATRLSGTFNNPDHFAAWLTMLVCLGVGVLVGSQSGRREAQPLTALLVSRRFREDWSRRYLPFLGVAIAALAVVLTLSRGGIISMLVGLGAMLVMFGRLGQVRQSAALLVALSAVTLVYAAWIGLGPLVARLAWDESRWVIYRATLPMLGRFPLFGIGLGGYQDIFFRYQPLALLPGHEYVSDAHNDFLQLVVETGIVGSLIAGYMAWQVVRDLFGAHLFGRGRCPVGGGEGQLAERHDPYSVGVGVGALGAVTAFCVHCLVDFPTRIPADGVLAAACLGIATVALHTRLSRPAQLLTERWSWSFGDRRVAPAALGLAAAVVGIVLVPWVVRPARIEAALGPSGAGVDAALALDPRDPSALALRGEARLAKAEKERQADVTESAIVDFRSALVAVPSDPFVHERLGRAYGLLATLESGRSAEHLASSLAHFKRSIAMAPENAFLYRALAAFALTRPASLLTIGLEASRGAVAREPALLPDLVERFDFVRLPDEQWIAVVPSAWPDRLELARLLEARGRVGAAETVYRAAIKIAPADDRLVGVWMLAGLLMRKGDAAAAAEEIEKVLPIDPRNPELLLVHGQALDARRDPAALDVYRAAVAQADRLAREGRSSPFKSGSSRIRSLVAERIGTADGAPIRYRRALARYLVDRGLWSQAGDEWDSILSLAPNDADAHFFRGIAWEGAGVPDWAIRKYREALALDPQPRFRLRLARLLWNTERYYEAMNEWRALLETEPENLEARLGLAQAHLREGDRLTAFLQFQHILKIAPDHPVARQEMARLTGADRKR